MPPRPTDATPDAGAPWNSTAYEAYEPFADSEGFLGGIADKIAGAGKAAGGTVADAGKAAGGKVADAGKAAGGKLKSFGGTLKDGIFKAWDFLKKLGKWLWVGLVLCCASCLCISCGGLGVFRR